MEKLAVRSKSTLAKIFGTILSILGALIVVLYKGPTVLSDSNPLQSPATHSPVSLSSQTNWILGGSLLVAEYLLVPVTYILQGILVTCFCFVVCAWGLRLKGPVYVSIFKPGSIVIAATLSVIFLGDALYLGTIVGAVILSLGFYAVIWGKAKEEELREEFGEG
ncbi:unnamed protein product [Lupinus luteus]|uniref:WAT1-related protein n=1 Tax=Lupinus luteus TaxID=3873 RepID=A0AAV1WTQ0_LUPLU